MKYLWDTDICVYFLNGNKDIFNRVELVGAENICTTMINIFELKFGAYNSTRIEANLARIKKLESRLTLLNDFNEEIGTVFAKNKASLRKQGITISDFDLLIASFANVNQLHLITNNTKHFKHIPGLTIENWVND